MSQPMKPPSSILRRTPAPLEALFSPRSVAVVGASDRERSVGWTVFRNLNSRGFRGAVYPVNQAREEVQGVRAYPSLPDLPERVDLAVIATPAATVPELVRDCVRAGVPGAVIVSAGFRETGPEGAELEEQVRREMEQGEIRIVGPNCLGFMIPPIGLNATFAAHSARAGNLGLISQSGAICTSILDWSLKENVGFSAFVSIGGMLDVSWGDLIDYLGNDSRTHSIIIYMESIGDARSFLSAAREVALSKPIIVLKAGRSQEAARAAASHTGGMTGQDDVLDAAFRRCGVLRVSSISELFYMAEVLAKQPRPKGPRLTVVTNAGGPGVLATDAVLAEGGRPAELSRDTIEQLDRLLPSHWSRNNPIDILGDARPDRYAGVLEVASKDTGSDGFLVVLTPQAMTDPTQTAEVLRSRWKSSGKPLLASWMGGADVAAGQDILNAARIPTFDYPDTAARMFAYMWRYSDNLRALYETPALSREEVGAETVQEVAARIEEARREGRELLTELESKEILNRYGIPTVSTELARSKEEALLRAGEIGYPVVLKLHSLTITHKSDVGGVALNLADEPAVEGAFERIRSSVAEKAGEDHFQGVTVQPMVLREGLELILGSSIDAQVGPILLFGTGGQLVEVFRDRALGLPPLTTTLARRLMEHTRIYRALHGVRGREPVDLSRLEQLLVTFSRLVVEQPAIREIDINPLLATEEGVKALDARIVLQPPEVTPRQFPQPAIRPYPLEYVERERLKNGEEVLIRPIRPEDEPLLVRFHETLSERTVYFRYFHLPNLSERVAHERLTRICFVDYDRDMVLVAERSPGETGEREILGVGRLSRIYGTPEAEFAILIRDALQGQGLGTALLSRLVRIGRREGVLRIVADMLPENRDMQAVARKVGFRVHYDSDENMVKASLDLKENRQ